MKTLILMVAEDAMTGENGLGFESLNINPDLFMVSADPLQIAHDYCEHVYGIEKIGSIHDELEALGGIMYVRGYDEILRRDGVGSRYSFDENLVSDIVRMFMERGITDFVPWPGTADESMSDPGETYNIVDLARRGIIEEYDRGGFTFSEYKEYINSITGYMERGYNKAAKRYESQQAANELFWAIFETIDSLDWDYCGQRFELSIDEGACTASVEEVYEDY